MPEDDLARAAGEQPATSHDVKPEWTLEEASAYFAEGGVPIEVARLQLIIRALKWAPVGERRAPGVTGRGKPTYLVADLMRLHSVIAPWIVVQGPAAGRNPETGSPILPRVSRVRVLSWRVWFPYASI